MHSSQPRRMGLAALASALAALGLAGTAHAQGDPVADRLAKAFRMDLSEVEVTYDLYPNRPKIEGQAELTFEMRPGQTRPLFHLNPVRGGGRTKDLHVELDGQRIPSDDVRYLSPGPHAEKGYEVERDLGPGQHSLSIRWSAPKNAPPQDPRWFFPNFDDTEGPKAETETIWPTVSSPDELATHVIHLRVHSKSPYRVIGSGEVMHDGSSDRLQRWTVTTPETVSSSNVFFAAVPASEFRVQRETIDGVEVTILSNQSEPQTDKAMGQLRFFIPRLEERLGPFPMESFSVFLTGWGSGMEYFGATRTGNGSLRHELGHMYYATTAINRTWRDTWLDEAIVTWWTLHGSLEPIEKTFIGHLADRPLLEPGFNEAAYGAGARVMERIAHALGGDDEMFAFLADLHARRVYQPYTTDDFIDDVLAAQNKISRLDLERWFYGKK